MNLRIIFLLLSVLTSACTTLRYEYQPPAGAQGRQCLATCTVGRQQCEQSQRQAETQCRQNYNMALIIYDECRKREKNKSACQSPSYCVSHGDNCREGFHDCYRQCGGKVLEIEEPL